MKSGYDLTKIKNEGYLILPLSMSKLASGCSQDPMKVYEVIVSFVKNKFHYYSNDVLLLYTNGMYMNTSQPALDVKKKMSNIAFTHANTLKKIVDKNKYIIPPALHYLPSDYILLNSPEFATFMTILKKREKEDELFRIAIKMDMRKGVTSYEEADVNFLLEEIVLYHILRQHLAELPRTLVKRDTWRLIAYPGSYQYSDCYQWQNRILPQTDKINPFASGQYNLLSNTYHYFDDEPSPVENQILC